MIRYLSSFTSLFFMNYIADLIIHLHRVTKKHRNPKEHQSPKYTHCICTEVREVRSSTNLVSSYRKTNKSISFYFFARRKRNPAILYVYMFTQGEKPIFLHRCAACVIWQSCSDSRPVNLQRSSIAVMSQGSSNLQLNRYDPELCFTASLMQIPVHCLV